MTFWLLHEFGLNKGDHYKTCGVYMIEMKYCKYQGRNE